MRFFQEKTMPFFQEYLRAYFFPRLSSPEENNGYETSDFGIIVFN